MGQPAAGRRDAASVTSARAAADCAGPSGGRRRDPV